MNKDLDDRLIPNGEYRDAQNISVGKSEEDDIGSLEPIIGNAIDTARSKPDFVARNVGVAAIGSSTVTANSFPDATTTGIQPGMAIIRGGGGAATIYGYIKSAAANVATLVSPLTVEIPDAQLLIYRAGTFSTLDPLLVIGCFADEANDRIITFSTDYNDTTNTSAPVYAPSEGAGSNHFIKVNGTIVVSGNFLNFSQNAFITGISLIENLLFWTDNRNQPRKINLELADNSYYDTENSISVAKYNPYEAITLLKKTTETGATSATNIITLASQNTAIKQGMKVVSTDITGGIVIQPSQYLYVTAIANTAPWTVTLNVAPAAAIISTDELTFIDTTMTGEDISPYFNGVEMPGVSNWPGDPDYLQDRFVRFSYRFQFDDGEYSIMAPFTQIAYIPEQKGYFLGSGGATPTPKDEEDAYRSTVVEFMENGVQNVELIIPLPDTGANINSKINYKINNIDILYKESDALAVKVIDTIQASALSGTDTTYTYQYQSRKPYKVLPTAQTTRVYDVVPVRAFSQETAGNRIIYGNFQDKHTSPESLDYNVGVGNKATTTDITNWAEYPNSSLKQNRNYQVGFILADKWGRQSTVVLSNLDEGRTDGIFFGGSTIYVPYDSSTSDIRNWFGDALKVLVNQPIGATTKNFPAGIPGLYATPTAESGYNSFSVTAPPIIVSDTSYTFTLGATYTAVPVIGDYLRGQYIDYVEVINTQPPSSTTASTSSDGGGNGLFLSTLNTDIQVGMVVTGFSGGQGSRVVTQVATPNPNSIIVINQSVNFLSSDVLTFTGSSYTVTTTGRVNESYLQTKLTGPDRKFAYTLNNPLGWYSYKVVVRQQEQDYYNVYLPGILNGYPDQTGTPPPFPTDEDGQTANIVLINDNINKIPRDLSEVGPEQKQFRSSVQLSPRVENNTTTTNSQYYPGVKTDTAVNIGTSNDSNMNFDDLGVNGKLNFYQIDTKPLIGRLSTANPIGVTTVGMRPYLAIYETEPTESLLDIFWETTQVGLIADLNSSVAVDFSGPIGFEPIVWVGTEALSNPSPLTNLVYPINSSAATLPATKATTFSVSSSSFDGLSTNNRTAEFTLYQELTAGADQYKYRINTNALFNFTKESSVTDVFTFSVTLTSWNFSTNAPLDPALFPPTTLTLTYSLGNIIPCFWDGTACYTSFPVVNATVQDTTNIVTRTAVNGSSANNNTDLFYSLDAATVTAGYFSIDSGTGQIDKISTTPIGTYDPVIKVQDAYTGTLGSFGGGTLFKELTQRIIVGPTPANSGIVSRIGFGNICQTRGIWNGVGVKQIIAPINPNTEVFGAWYVADGFVPDEANGRPEFVIPSYAGSGTQTFVPTASNSYSTYYHRLGTSALTQGTIVLSCCVSQQFSDDSDGQTQNNGSTIFRVYHRANSTSAWSFITDINNRAADSTGATLITAPSTMPTGFQNPNTFYRQTNFAFNTVGEYLVTAVSSNTPTGPSVQEDGIMSWVNSDDLYFSSCVVDNGTNFTNTTPLDPTDAGYPALQKYQFAVQGPTDGYRQSTGSSPTLFSQTPYAGYVTEFYTDSTLTEVRVPATPFFYEYKTWTGASPIQPFDGSDSGSAAAISSARFDSTTGIKISSGLTGATTPINPCASSGDAFALDSVNCRNTIVGGLNRTYP